MAWYGGRCQYSGECMGTHMYRLQNLLTHVESMNQILITCNYYLYNVMRMHAALYHLYNMIRSLLILRNPRMDA